MSDVRYCEDCRHYGGRTFLSRIFRELADEKCLHIGAVRSDADGGAARVRKNIAVKRSFCSTQRAVDSPRYCGPDAAWFEPKEPSHV